MKSLEQNPNYFDGSVQHENVSNNEPQSNEPFQLTDEMRRNIGGNPYYYSVNEKE